MKLYEIQKPYFALIRANNVDKAIEFYNDALLMSNLEDVEDGKKVLTETSPRNAMRAFRSKLGFVQRYSLKGFIKGMILEGKKEGVLVLDHSLAVSAARQGKNNSIQKNA
ncbi:hypothetical protein [Bacillus safensis]|uniref:hypothetical protein n=1 Tax=Bacillus safensis TaxID=561879 RepID=UPI002E23A8F5|nr:hypothetical protein [Bacillus safensis]